eukprot:3716669-Pyramimonas_sp.AAC.2
MDTAICLVKVLNVDAAGKSPANMPDTLETFQEKSGFQGKRRAGGESPSLVPDNADTDRRLF